MNKSFFIKRSEVLHLVAEDEEKRQEKAELKKRRSARNEEKKKGRSSRGRRGGFHDDEEGGGDGEVVDLVNGDMKEEEEEFVGRNPILSPKDINKEIKPVFNALWKASCVNGRGVPTVVKQLVGFDLTVQNSKSSRILEDYFAFMSSSLTLAQIKAKIKTSSHYLSILQFEKDVMRSLWLSIEYIIRKDASIFLTTSSSSSSHSSSSSSTISSSSSTISSMDMINWSEVESSVEIGAFRTLWRIFDEMWVDVRRRHDLSPQPLPSPLLEWFKSKHLI